MSVSAVRIISNPAPLLSSTIELRSSSVVYPNSLAPFGHIGKVGLLIVKLLVRHHVAERFGGCAILQPDCMLDCLCPEGFGQSQLVEHSSHTFEHSSIEGLSYAIMLRRVGHRKTSLGTLVAQIIGEFLTSELTASV